MNEYKPIDLYRRVINNRNVTLRYCFGKYQNKIYPEEDKEITIYRRSRIKYIYNIYNYNIYKECKSIITYLDEFCETFSLEWDLLDSNIVIHYPKVVVSGHIITDIWVRIPIWFINVGDTSFRRTSYTLNEIQKNYCHPHINYDANTNWSCAFCMGRTRFSCTSSPSLNILSFLYYLNSFLTHEHNYNPYISTSSIIKVESEYPIVRHEYKYDLNEIDIQYTNINDNIVISPVLTKKTKEYLIKTYQNILVWEINGQIYLNKKIDYSINENPFTFRGRNIKNTITDNNLQKKDAIINPLFYDNWKNYVTKEITEQYKKYMETIYSDKRESIEQMQISL